MKGENEIVVKLVYSDGHETQEVLTHVLSLAVLIKQLDVETLVFGERTPEGKVVWEKQFNAVTVMPSSFGAPQD